MNELESLLAFFASFVLDTTLVAQILRWDMVVLKESPWYQEILHEGERRGELRGKQEGRQEGRQEGLEEEARSLILKLLTRKLGNLSPKVRSQVESLSISQLEALGEELLDFTAIADLTQWLQNH